MRYFVTGATGFIGKRLVRKLLASPDNTVWFLLREESGGKLDALLEFWNARDGRAIPVTGDLRRPRCGVGDRDLDMLAGRIDHFFHLGAIYDLRAAADAQLATNIDGTRHAVDLAGELRAGCFHHVSSIAAAGLYEGLFREDMFEEAENLQHPYFSTKHAAEKIVRTVCRIPWRIYRPGMVVGDSKTGETDKADGPYYFFKLIQKMRSVLPPWLPTIGIEGGRLNIVPVDYVVDAMQVIAHRPGLDGQCFHLTDPAPVRVGDLLDIVARAAHAPPMTIRVNAAVLNLVPAGLRRGLAVLRPVRRLREAIMRELGLPEGVLQFINYPTRFDNRNTVAALQGSGVACPELSRYADRLWDYWERHLDPDLFIDRSLTGQVQGKTVLLTGGSSGIGLATVHRLAEAGATTIICGRDQSKLDAARAALRERGYEIRTFAVNLAEPEDVARFVQELDREFGHIDILVNNAGRSIRRAVDASYDRFHDFERTMQLNYFGALRLTLGLLPGMVSNRSGQVINISTIGVLTSAPRFSAYVASKAALDAWTACAAAELSDAGIRFTTINMPLVRTPMIAPTGAYRDVPALTPDEAAELVVQAIVRKPVRLATSVGLTGQGLQLLAPELAQITLNTAYRMFPEADAAGAGAGQTATPELLAMQHLLRGLHL